MIASSAMLLSATICVHPGHEGTHTDGDGHETVEHDTATMFTNTDAEFGQARCVRGSFQDIASAKPRSSYRAPGKTLS